MRILQVLQRPQLRGAEIFANQLSNHLLDLDNEIIIVYLAKGDEVLSFRGNVKILNRPLSRRLLDVRGWKALSHIVKQFNPDIVQANAGDTLKFAVFSKLFFGWPAHIIFRNANKVSDFIDSWLKKIFNKFLVSRVQHVISVSENCRQDFINTYSYLAHKTTTITIGIEQQPILSSLPEELKMIFGTGKVIAHVGSFVPEKNHKGLIRIMAPLLKSDGGLKIVLLGDGKLRNDIEDYAKAMHVRDQIYFLGGRSDVLSIILHANVLVLPSQIEGLPGVLLEAMYCRVPVVAYDVGGVSELVKHGETGWLVRKNDEGGFLKAVTDVLDGINVEPIKENAYRLVVEQFDNREIAKRFEGVYRQVLGNN